MKQALALSSSTYRATIAPLTRMACTKTRPRQTVFHKDSTFDLLNKYVVFQMCRFPFLIKNSRKLTAISYKLLGKSLTNFAIKNTFGKVFTGGENLEDLTRNMEILKRCNVYVIADLSIEDVGDAPEDMLEFNKHQILTLIKAMHSQENQTMSLKVTSLVRRKTLKELSAGQKKLDMMFTDIAGFEQNVCISKNQVKSYIATKFHFNPTDKEVDEFFSMIKNKTLCDDSERISATEFFMNVHAFPLSPRYQSRLIDRIVNFPPETQAELQSWVDRVLSIVNVMKESKSSCMIDAEQTYVQAGTDSITRQLQQLYNTDRVVIMHSFQAYLKDSKRKVLLDLQSAKANNRPFAAKLVRGAYMTEERRIASKAGIESPILPTKPDVDQNYNEIISMVLREMPKKSHLNIATHNEYSIKFALEEARSTPHEMQKRILSFSQLKGLGDSLTFSLAGEGVYVFKYVPYGPTEFLVPYLLRRAEEASYIFREGKKQLAELNTEMFGTRKLHIKAATILAGLIILRIVLKKQLYRRYKDYDL